MKFKSEIETFLKTSDFSFFKGIIDRFFLDYVSLNMSFSFLKSTRMIYRTRRYEKNDASERYDDKTLEFQGYNKEESGVSPYPGNNRYSNTETQCFYGSLDLETSIYEVFDSKYLYYSVATVCPVAELKLIDISLNKVFIMDEDNKKVVSEFIDLIMILNNLDENYYSFSQEISSYIMMKFNSLGIDGLMYDSYKSKNGCANIAVFNYNKLEILNSKLKKLGVDFSIYNMKE